MQTAKKLGSAPYPTLVIEYGITLLYLLKSNLVNIYGKQHCFLRKTTLHAIYKILLRNDWNNELIYIIPRLFIKPSLLVKLGICFLRFLCISSKSTKSGNKKQQNIIVTSLICLFITNIPFKCCCLQLKLLVLRATIYSHTCIWNA